MSRLSGNSGAAASSSSQASIARAIAPEVKPMGAFSDVKAVVRGQIPESATTVLLGECTHGTEEFYQLRADISKFLIEVMKEVLKYHFVLILFIKTVVLLHYKKVCRWSSPFSVSSP